MIGELLHVLADPAHWVAEVVMDGTLTLLALPLMRGLMRRHDRLRHGKIGREARRPVEEAMLGKLRNRRARAARARAIQAQVGSFRSWAEPRGEQGLRAALSPRRRRQAEALERAA